MTIEIKNSEGKVIAGLKVKQWKKESEARFVAYMDGHNNLYHDSYFYYMIYDKKKQKAIKHTYGSTAWGGSVDFGNPLYFDLENEFNYEEKAIEYFIEKRVEEKTGGYQVGDIVKNTNPRARKHKGVQFRVLELSEWRSRYGRVESITLIGENEEGEEIKVNSKNCEIILKDRNNVKEDAERDAIGIR